MVAYALLGATGATGAAVLRHLLSNPPSPLRLNLLVRSRTKLLEMFPAIEKSNNLNIQIFEGSSDDMKTVSSAIHGVDVILSCVGTNHCAPGISLVADTARTIVTALEEASTTDGQSFVKPTILQLRSVSLNPILSANTPVFVRQALLFCLHYVYADVARACDLYESVASRQPNLLDLIIVDPPAIHNPDDQISTGYKLVLSSSADMSPTLSYADLGIAFCELSARRGEFLNESVGVSATGPVQENWRPLIGYILWGLKSRIVG